MYARWPGGEPFKKNKITLVMCPYSTACAMCGNDTPWRIDGGPDEDFHLCSNECYNEADGLGMIETFVKRLGLATESEPELVPALVTESEQIQDGGEKAASD